MKRYVSLQLPIRALVTILILEVWPAYGQNASTICTGAMINSFGSCINFLSIGSNASSPTRNCCDSLKSLMSNGQDCLCLIVTGGVPFQVPINRNLAISLPRACKMSGVPVECKAHSTPVPAPGPVNPFEPGPSPRSSPPSPTGPIIPGPLTPPSSPEGNLVPPRGDLSPPGGDVNPLNPGGDLVPTLTPPGMRPTLTPSAAPSSHRLSLPPLVVVLGAILLMHC